MKLTSQSKRDLILEAAERMFLKKGFFPTKIDDIARRAKVAKGTVYLYFKDKESLYIDLLAKKLDEGIAFLEEMVKREGTPKEKLRIIFEEWINRILESKGLPCFLSLENINITAKIIKKLRRAVLPRLGRMVALIGGIIGEGVREREFREVNQEAASFLFLNLLHLTFLYQMLFGGRSQREGFAEIFFRGVER